MKSAGATDWIERLRTAAASFLLDRTERLAVPPAAGPADAPPGGDAPPARARRPTMRGYLRTVFLLSTAPLLVLAGALGFNTVVNQRETVQNGMIDVARALSSTLDAEVGRTLLALQMLGQTRAFDEQDWRRLRTMADTLRDTQGSLSNLAVFALDGRRVITLHANDPASVAVPANTDFLVAAREGRTLTSNAFTSAASGRTSVSISVPVMREGKPVYVLSAAREFDVWTDWLKRRVPAGAVAALDDRDGVIFARSEHPETFVGTPAAAPLARAYARRTEGVIRLVNAEGQALYAAYHTSQATGWHTLVLRPATDVDGPLHRYTAWLALGTAIVVVLAYLASTLLLRRLEGATASLRDAIATVGEGRIPARRSLPVAELDDAQGAAEHAGEVLRRARIELERREQELRTMFDVMPVGLLVAHDPRADEVTISASFADLTGLPTGENVSMSGPNLERLPHRYEQNGRVLDPDELPMQRAARRGEEVRDMEMDMVFRDGRVLNLLGYAAPLFDDHGRLRGAIGANVNITPLKQAHRALEAADRQKNDFLATLAHELRNPMAPIRYAIALMQRDPTPGAATKAVRIIDRQAGHMARLLDDLLDLSRITRNLVELKREPVELHSILSAAVENARPMSDEHGHRLETETDPMPLWVHGDPARLLQIVDNLLNNACKYTDDGGRITVRLRRDGDRCAIEVSDTGAGIAPEMVPAVFAMFGRVDPAAQGAKGGLGIGLAVVRRLVELHGGTIGVHSDGPGKGSTFTVTLPRLEHVEPRSASPPPAPVGDHELARLRVLIVDDNVDAADTLAMVLGLAGARTGTAHTAAEAIAEAEAMRPDAVLLDVGLPDGSGLDVARHLRKTEWGRTAFLVAITGWGRNEDRTLTADAGIDTHLVKPVDANQVIALLTGFAHRP